MHPLLFEIELEHGNVRKVLNHLAALADQLDNDRSAVVDHITLCLEYLHLHSGVTHHSNEDMILQRLQHRKALTDPLRNVCEDHNTFEEIVQRLITTLRNHPKSAKLKNDLLGYIERHRRHMQLEEEHLFPAAEEALSSDDWSAVEVEWLQQPDPIFGPKRRKRFLSLALAIHSG